MIIELPRRVPSYAMPEMGFSIPGVSSVVNFVEDAGEAAWDIQKKIYTVPTELAFKATTALTSRAAAVTKDSLNATKSLVGNLKGAVGGIGGGAAQNPATAGQLPAALQNPDGGTNWPLILGGAAAVGLVAFALLRKKKASK